MCLEMSGIFSVQSTIRCFCQASGENNSRVVSSQTKPPVDFASAAISSVANRSPSYTCSCVGEMRNEHRAGFLHSFSLTLRQAASEMLEPLDVERWAKSLAIRYEGCGRGWEPTWRPSSFVDLVNAGELLLQQRVELRQADP